MPCKHFPYKYIYILIFNIKINTLNINGLNTERKQQMLINYMEYNKIDIMLLQEHNIREMGKINKELNEKYQIIINPAIQHKGGTAILLNRKLDLMIKNYEMSADSRIISAIIEISNKPLHIVNIYAPSGSNNSDRDEFFKVNLTYYLRNNIDNTIIGGDFNCVTSSRDSSSNSTHVCRALLNNFKGLRMKDPWYQHNSNVGYTYIRNDYGSRLDRFYLKELSSSVQNVSVKHANFSDHSCVQIEMKLTNIKVGKFYWKLNVSLLEDSEIKEEFIKEWDRLKFMINRYNNINEWWEGCAKKAIKTFFL